jgi:fucose 4-O-acetylase-like acetyltransferase
VTPPPPAATLERQAAPAPAPAPAREDAPRSRTGRDPFLDNAKFLLVALVVVGHAWTLASHVDLLYSWLYLWHVPAFVLVTGYLSRSFRFTRRHLHRLAVTVAFPYALFEGLFALLRIHVGGEKLELLWLNPHWPMWYLSVLFLWRLATPALQRVPHVVPLSFAVSLVGGFLSVHYLDVNRAMGLLPFFVLGLTVTPAQVERLRQGVHRRAALLVLLAGVGLAWFVESRLSTEWLYYRTPYAELDVTALQGVAIRATLLVTGLAMSAAVLSWIPGRTTWYTRLGAASLVVYLFHGFVVEGLAIAGMSAWSADHPWTSVALTTVGGFGLATSLAWRPVAKRLDKVVTPPPLLP